MSKQNVLMVAEKPSLAESIAKFLSNGKMHSRKSTSPACSVHEYDGNFLGKPAHFKVTSVAGHEYNSWDTVQPIELFAASTIKLEANPKTHIVKHLQNEAKGIDALVLWLDCDREGENICFEVIRSTKIELKAPEKGRKDERIYRAKFSAVTASEIKNGSFGIFSTNAMNNLGKPNEDEAKAVDVRQELDLKVGVKNTVKFIRELILLNRSDVHSLDIRRDSSRENMGIVYYSYEETNWEQFVPEPFWNIGAIIEVEGTQITLTSERGRIFDKKKATDIRNTLKGMKTAKVISAKSEKKSTSRPHALNTVEMLKAASSGLGIAPHETMQIAERLYIQGYISYPRTETSKYPPSFDLKGALEIQRSNLNWGSYATDLLTNGFTIPEGGHDAGDHPPITPMRSANEDELGGNTWRLYDYITRHFIGSISSNLYYTKTTAIIEIGSDKFSWTGNRVIKPGFSSVMHWKMMSDQLLPCDLKEDDVFNVADVTLKEGKTSPPDYLTESDLIGLMEKLGIGTDASMAVHISNICTRRYVSVEGNARHLVPTNLGIVLIHGYQKIDPDLALPSLRASMEKRISLIATGKERSDKVLEEEISIFKKKFEEFMAKIGNMDELFEATFSPLSSSGKPFSICGKCRRYMHLINLRPVRLHCRTCNETYSLPSNGQIKVGFPWNEYFAIVYLTFLKLYKELRCPVDKFQLVLNSSGSKGKGFPICPHCYNLPPFENISAGMGCNTCPHTTCEHSVTKNWVTPCPSENCTGVMVLDATSAPRWKLCCNVCTMVTAFVDTINEVTICEVCEDCSSKLVTVSFRKNQSKEDIEEACIVCDDELEALLETRCVLSDC
ncbi:DNA topoisomerase 3-beta-1 [Nowakowskiella sp. JEL0407]|nr:DNA topoisomerase 3-beta-1 [Nowakowskiella sp. JEL0407]